MHFGPLRGSQNYTKPKPATVAGIECWYDREIKFYTAIFVDEEANQIGVAHYATRSQKKAMLARMKPYVGTAGEVPSSYEV